MSDASVNYDPSRIYMQNRVAQPEPRLQFLGVLRPEKGFAPPEQVAIEKREVVIGRQQGLGLSLPDDWVSHRHARILRVGDEFVLEDLRSSNGTYVDGVPIISCVLRSGDWIQIGRNLFRFELQLASATALEDLTTWLE